MENIETTIRKTLIPSKEFLELKVGDSLNGCNSVDDNNTEVIASINGLKLATARRCNPNIISLAHYILRDTKNNILTQISENYFCIGENLKEVDGIKYGYYKLDGLLRGVGR